MSNNMVTHPLFGDKMEYGSVSEWLRTTLTMFGNISYGEHISVWFIDTNNDRHLISVYPRSWSYPLDQNGASVVCSLKVDDTLLGGVTVSRGPDGEVDCIFYDPSGLRLDLNGSVDTVMGRKDVMNCPMDLMLFYQSLMETVHTCFLDVDWFCKVL